jgi:hypothetical protein
MQGIGRRDDLRICHPCPEALIARCFPTVIDGSRSHLRPLGRRTGSTKRQLEKGGLGYNVKSGRIPEGRPIEREALTAARNQRTLTQDFCGDPPPGYSALRHEPETRLIPRANSSPNFQLDRILFAICSSVFICS